MDFVDQTDIQSEYSVFAKLDIPPRYDQGGQGGALLHPLQGVVGVGLLHGDGLEYCTEVPKPIRVTARFEMHIVAPRP